MQDPEPELQTTVPPDRFTFCFFCRSRFSRPFFFCPRCHNFNYRRAPWVMYVLFGATVPPLVYALYRAFGVWVAAGAGLVLILQLLPYCLARRRIKALEALHFAPRSAITSDGRDSAKESDNEGGVGAPASASQVNEALAALEETPERPAAEKPPPVREEVSPGQAKWVAAFGLLLGTAAMVVKMAHAGGQLGVSDNELSAIWLGGSIASGIFGAISHKGHVVFSWCCVVAALLLSAMWLVIE
jgi:hypothetical protein